MSRILSIVFLCISALSFSSCSDTVSPSQGALTPSSTTLDYGTVSVGTRSVQTLTLKNTGSASLTITAFTINGANFQIDTAITLPVTLAQNASISLPISYTPTATKSDGASLMIATTGTKDANTSVILMGNGKAYAVVAGNSYTYNTTNYDAAGVSLGSSVTISTVTNADTTYIGKAHCFKVKTDTSYQYFHAEANGDLSYYFPSNATVNFLGAGWVVLPYASKTAMKVVLDTNASITVPGAPFPIPAHVIMTVGYTGVDSITVGSKTFQLGVARIKGNFSVNVPGLLTGTVDVIQDFAYSPVLGYFGKQAFSLTPSASLAAYLTGSSSTDVLVGYVVK